MVYVTDPQKLLTPPAQLYLSRAHCYLSLGRPLLALSDANKALKVTRASCGFTGCPVKLFPLCYLLFCRLLLIQNAKVGTFLKNSENLLHDRHKNFEN